MKLVLAFAASAVARLPVPASAQHEHAAAGADQVGSDSVSFLTSCAPALRQDFNRAVALLHSFWFAQAIATFDGVAAKDPSCAMAHWGVALSRWGNPFAGLRSPQQIELGRAAIQRALTTGTPTPRERAYIAAAAELFTSGDAATQRARTVAYEQGMERVVRGFPGDMEARIFYALAANQTAVASDKKYSQQLKAAAILEPLFKEHPKHPGLAHYIIHAYDHPPLAEKALAAARTYASLAPAVPHALHMPSHTFTRVGMWKESIETNRRSAEAALKENATAEALHAMDYQAYAYLQTREGRRARRVAGEARAAAARLDPNARWRGGARRRRGLCVRRHSRAIRARAWRVGGGRGAGRRARSTFPHTDAIIHFARALGAARSGNPKAAAADIERLAALRDALKTMQDAVLGRAGGHPAADRDRVDHIRGRRQGARHRAAARGGGRRGCDGQIRRLTRPARAGARAARLHAARGRAPGGCARRVRSHDQEGTESLPRSIRRRAGRGGSRPARACDRALQTTATGSQ